MVKTRNQHHKPQVKTKIKKQCKTETETAIRSIEPRVVEIWQLNANHCYGALDELKRAVKSLRPDYVLVQDPPPQGERRQGRRIYEFLKKTRKKTRLVNASKK